MIVLKNMKRFHFLIVSINSYLDLYVCTNFPNINWIRMYAMLWHWSVLFGFWLSDWTSYTLQAECVGGAQFSWSAPRLIYLNDSLMCDIRWITIILLV